MNLWLSLVVGGIATTVSVSIVIYTIFEEHRAKDRKSASSVQQHKLLSSKPRLSRYDGQPRFGRWNASDVSVIMTRNLLNPASTLKSEPDWLAHDDAFNRLFTLAMANQIREANSMAFPLGTTTFWSPTEKMTFVKSPQKLVAY